MTYYMLQQTSMQLLQTQLTHHNPLI